MTFKSFHSQIFALIAQIQDSLEQYPPTKELRVPADLSELRSVVRNVAEKLILCIDVDAAITRLRQDHAALLAVMFLITELPDEDVIFAERRAYKTTPGDTTTLPALAFSSFLIELCSTVEVVKRDDSEA